MFSSPITSPVVSGHRGFKGKYPENSFFGFEKCYKAGSPLIETDLWLSKDEVVIVSHDVSTKRVFQTAAGEPTDFDILTTNYEGELKSLKYIACEENLHTFKDLLKWYMANHNINAEEKNGDVQFNRLMLDIKRPNPPRIIKVILQDMLEVHNDLNFWIDRVQFGIWDLKNIKYLNQEAWFREMFEVEKRQIEIINISTNWGDSLHYLEYNTYVDQLTKQDGKFRFKVSGVSLLYLLTWSKDFLTKFMPLVKLQDLSLYSWTVNFKGQFDYLWQVGNAFGLREFGIISDDPAAMVEYKESKQETSETSKLLEPSEVKLTLAQRWNFWLFGGLFKRSSVTEEDKKFDSYVDGDLIVRPKASKVMYYIFSTLQHLGIF